MVSLSLQDLGDHGFAILPVHVSLSIFLMLFIATLPSIRKKKKLNWVAYSIIVSAAFDCNMFYEFQLFQAVYANYLAWIS